MLNKSIIYLKLNKKKKYLNVYLNKHLIISQKILKSTNKNISNSMFTFFYISFILNRLGLIIY